MKSLLSSILRILLLRLDERVGNHENSTSAQYRSGLPASHVLDECECRRWGSAGVKAFSSASISKSYHSIVEPMQFQDIFDNDHAIYNGLSFQAWDRSASDMMHSNALITPNGCKS